VLQTGLWEALCARSALTQVFCLLLIGIEQRLLSLPLLACGLACLPDDPTNLPSVRPPAVCCQPMPTHVPNNCSCLQ
jgi:hypothetical protein